MFKYISEILGNFTQRERIIVLVLLLVTIVALTKGIGIINSIKGIPEDIKGYVENIENDNNRYKNEIIQLKSQIVENGIECTNTILNRELEIRGQIHQLVEYMENTLYRNSEKVNSIEIEVLDSVTIDPSAPAPMVSDVNESLIDNTLSRLKYLEHSLGNQN